MSPRPPSAVAAFRGNPRLQAIAAAYALVWIWTAIAPASRVDWALENLLVAAFLALLVGTYRRFPLSDASYAMIALFMAMHAFGAQSTYAEMPLGNWIKESFGHARNHYDRVVHFAFGLLFVYPLREVLMRASDLRGALAAVIAALLILALSTCYELIEWLVASIVSPEAAFDFLGTQGDPFDAQKDSALAGVGAAITMALDGVRRQFSGRPVRR